jgi:hypothetical protein
VAVTYQVHECGHSTEQACVETDKIIVLFLQF